MNPQFKRLYTIGYEGITIEDLMDTLKREKVETLWNVHPGRFRRKSGFTKYKMIKAGVAADIAYFHYPEFMDDLVEEIGIADVVALLGFENDPDKCSRHVVADEVRSRLAREKPNISLTVIDLVDRRFRSKAELRKKASFTSSQP